MSERHERYPLSWPADWKRTAPHHRRAATFGKVDTPRRTAEGETFYSEKKRLSLDDAFGRIERALGLQGVEIDTVIVSTNLKLNMRGMPTGAGGEPSDPGVAVYWIRKGKAQAMAIDQYTRVADNLAAVAATLEAMRAIERHGGAQIMERAFLGFAQLPASASRPWRLVLDLPHTRHVTVDIIDERFRELAKRHHPDKGGDVDAFNELAQARTDALRELGG